MKRAIAFTLIGTLLALAAGGCPRSSSTNGTNGTNYEFTTARQEAVTLVVEQVVAACEAFASMAALGDARLDLSVALGNFGTCPVVTYASSGTAAVVQLDFGQGCSAAASGTATIAGQVNINSTIGGAYRITFSGLTIDGNAVTGTLDTLPDSGQTNLSDWTGRGNVATASVGEVNGTVTFQVTDVGEIVLGGTDVRLGDGTTSYLVTLATVTSDPPDRDNSIPESGSVSFLDTALVRITVSFSERSTREGVVRVTVGDGSAVNFQALTLTN